MVSRPSVLTVVVSLVLLSRSGFTQPPDEVAEPGYLGMTVDAGEREYLRVVQVERDGPAERGGVRAGDLLLAINDQPLRGASDLIRILRSSAVGTRLDLLIERHRRRLQLRVTLSKSPVARSRTPMLGVRTVEVTPELREQYKLPLAYGALVTSVSRDSPADKAGIPRFALIAKINGHTVSTPNDLLRWVKQAGPGGHVELIYYEGGRLQKTSLKLADSGDTSGIAPDPAEGQASPTRQPPPVRPRPVLPTSDRQRIRLLEQRIEQLEKRVSELEKQAA